MKTDSFKGNNPHCKVNIILRQLATRTINKIARSKGHIQRKSFVICPKSLIVGFMLMVSKQRNTYTDWATEIGLIEGRSFSKQALNERMQPQPEKFVKQVVEQTISKQLCMNPSPKTNGVLRHFENVMIDDSTTLSLPDALAGTFPGNVSKGVKKAQAKIHAMYNMTENKFARWYVCLDLLCFDRGFVQTRGFIHIILYFIGVHEITTLCWSFAFQKDEKTIEFFYFFLDKKVTKVQELKFFELKNNSRNLSILKYLETCQYIKIKFCRN